MKIQRKYKDPGEKWIKIDKVTCLKFTENAGYYKWGTVLNMITEGHTVSTPFATFKRGLL